MRTLAEILVAVVAAFGALALWVYGLRAEHPATFFVTGVVGYGLVVGAAESFVRALGVERGASLLRGRHARIRSILLLALDVPLFPALLFALLLTKESGDGWAFAVLGLLAFKVATTSMHVASLVRRVRR